jgi:hypothetical protein
MKTMKLVAMLMSGLILYSSQLSAGEGKTTEPLEKESIELNLSQFGKYLYDGNPDSLEGVYTTADKRYKIALIKNKAKTHDFIGVVVSADNPYWKNGEVKFNFVVNEENQLEGYYYDSMGRAYPVAFELGRSTIDSPLFQKLKTEEVIAGNLASL